MEVGQWGGNMSVGWMHRRGFVVYEVLLADLGAEIPFTPFEVDLLNHLNCCPAQLMANSWRSLKFLQEAAWRVGVQLTVRLFLLWFSVKLKDDGRVVFQRKARQLDGFPASISNWKNWNDRYFPIVQSGSGRPWWVGAEDDRPLFPVVWSDAKTGASPIKYGHLSAEERRVARLMSSFIEITSNHVIFCLTFRLFMILVLFLICVFILQP